QSFVRTTGRGKRPVILRSIIALAHDLGMDVVAEGAETDSDAIELYQLGCEYAQGFAFGYPMTADEATRILTSEQLEPARWRTDDRRQTTDELLSSVMCHVSSVLCRPSSVLYEKRHSALRAQRQPRDRLRLTAWNRTESIRAHQHRQDHRRLDQRKARPDADA